MHSLVGVVNPAVRAGLLHGMAQPYGDYPSALKWLTRATARRCDAAGQCALPRCYSESKFQPLEANRRSTSNLIGRYAEQEMMRQEDCVREQYNIWLDHHDEDEDFTPSDESAFQRYQARRSTNLLAKPGSLSQTSGHWSVK